MKKPARLVSLDAFRGLTMAAMVIVNNPGDWGNVYSPLLHAEWNGWTPTDLIFPFFLFIVGVSMTLSQGDDGRSRWRIVQPRRHDHGARLAPVALPVLRSSRSCASRACCSGSALCYLAAAFRLLDDAAPGRRIATIGGTRTG